MFLRALSNYGRMILPHDTTPGICVRGERPIVGAGEIIHDHENQWTNESTHIKGNIIPDGREVVIPKSYLQPI